MYVRSVKANKNQAKNINLVERKQLAFGVLQLSNLVSNGAADVCRLC